MAQPTKILLALILGAVSGILSQIFFGADNKYIHFVINNLAQPVGQIFLNMIFMMIVPLIFSSLILGISEIGSAKKVGQVGGKAFMIAIMLSTVAVCVALVATTVFAPGKKILPEERNKLLQIYSSKNSSEKAFSKQEESQNFVNTIVRMVPRNPIGSAVNLLRGGFLSFVVFTIIFGLALASIAEEKATTIKSFLEGLFLVCLKVIDFAMRLAPYGVFGLIFSTTAVVGLGALNALASYVGVVIGALLFHMIIVYGITLKYAARISPIYFFKNVREVMVTAFATSSSNATLPTTIRVTIENFKLPRDISTFLLTLGATASHNGTALFEGITILFLAQLFGVDLTIFEQLTVMGMALIAGIGTAGVPAGSLPMIALILLKFGIPAEAIGICIGLDRLLDMSRTVVNVIGDMVITICVSHFEEKEKKKHLVSG